MEAGEHAAGLFKLVAVHHYMYYGSVNCFMLAITLSSL